MKRNFRDKHEIRRAYNMQKFNNNTRIIIGVDHGYGNMKTAHRVFRTGMECMEEEPIVKIGRASCRERVF